MSGDDTSKSAVRRRSPRWVRILLVVSLAINLLVVGAIVGSFAHSGGGWSGPWGRWQSYRIIHNLPADRRARVHEIWRSYRQKLRPKRAALKQAWGDVMKRLGEEPLDQKGVEAALERATKAELAVRRSLAPMIVGIAGELDSAQRRRFIKGFANRHRHRFGRWHGERP